MAHFEHNQDMVLLPPFGGGGHEGPVMVEWREDQRHGDKLEFSPGNKARCQSCQQTVREGELRIGNEVYSELRSKYIYQYYHEHCCPNDVKQHLHLPNERNFQDEKIRQEGLLEQNATLVQRRWRLYRLLRSIRRALALREGRPTRWIFADKTLKEMAVKLPNSRAEMLSIYGMGPTKYERYGRAFLTEIQSFRAFEVNRNERHLIRP